MADFTFHYDRTLRQAKELEDLARDIQNGVVRKLGDVCGNLEAAWTGEAGEAYYRHIQGVQGDLLKKAKYLQQTAEFLRTAAKKIRSAEEAAQAAARRIK